MLKYLSILSLFLILVGCNQNSNESQTTHTSTPTDSCEYYIKKTKTKGLNKKKAEIYLQKATKFVNTSQDSLMGRQLEKIAFRYYILGDSVQFNILNQRALSKGFQLNDSLNIGNAYWNYANMYKQKDVNDSAYIYYKKAYEYFNTEKTQKSAAKMLYNMSLIQGKFKNVSISEQLIIRSITIFRKLGDSKAVYACYNHLAILQNDSEIYDAALQYHQLALDYLNDLPNREKYEQTSFNNIGNTYLKKGDFKMALTYFNPLIAAIDTVSSYSEEEARILDNWAFCRFQMGDTLGLQQIFKQNLQILERSNNTDGIILSNIRLAKYSSFKQDTLLAYQFATRAKDLAKAHKNGSNYLESLQLLTQLDTQNENKYLQDYIHFSDSLAKVELQFKNKFARIAYETDQYITANERLSKKNLSIIIISIGLGIILLLIFAIWIQRSKNEKLILESEQQRASEQIYQLTHSQQTLLEQERNQEQKRISEELHDGILGQLFGLRMSIGFKNMENRVTTDDLKYLLNELMEIETEIRQISHRLHNGIILKEISFADLVSEIVSNSSKLGNFNFEINVSESLDWQRINEVIFINLYRIIQEAMHNIVKHAKATYVTVTIKMISNSLIVEIIDNGIGFQLSTKKNGIGVKNMRSRIKKIYGHIQIESVPNRGTSISCKIPLKEK